MNTNYSLPQFKEPITDLPTVPNLTPEELKRRFQAPADEVREVHNLLCAEVARLNTVVSGLVAQTFTEAITEEMLDSALSTKLNAKADQTALDETNSTAAEMLVQLAEKNGVYCSSYTGDGTYERVVSLGFRPKAVLASQNGSKFYVTGYHYGGLACEGAPAKANGADMLQVCDDGFLIHYGDVSPRSSMNDKGVVYNFIAIR